MESFGCSAWGGAGGRGGGDGGTLVIGEMMKVS